MSTPITSYSDERLAGSLFVKPFQKTCKRLNDEVYCHSETQKKVAEYALQAIKVLGAVFMAAITAPLALLGRLIQVIHYHTLKASFRDDPHSADSVDLRDFGTKCRYTVSRIGDQSYLLSSREPIKKVIVTIDSKITPQTSFHLACAIAALGDSLIDQKMKSNLTLGGMSWQVSPAMKERLPKLLLSFLNSFAHPPGDDGIVRLSVNKASVLTSYRGQKPSVVMGHSGQDSPLAPFTNLAQTAFQQVEPYYRAVDDYSCNDDSYVIVKEGGGYLLKRRKWLSRADVDSAKSVAVEYRNHLIDEYGEEKVRYIEYHYRFDLRKDVALTPEHIFRANIGANNIEVHDLEEFLQRICTNCPLTGREQRGIARLGGKPTFVGKKRLAELTAQEMNQLMLLFSPSKEEWDAIFTGRSIYEESVSAYATADTKEYKPWIDQQELLRIFPLLSQKAAWKLFYEKCAFTIVKTHLIKEHPIDGLRIGSIIPAPADSNGRGRWYKVSKAINNGYGLVSYILESACADATLPLIYLSRSTASLPYSIDSSPSMHNNSNPWNSPGYEGISYADSYVEEFFNSFSIPIWSLYLQEAKRLLDLNDDNLLPEVTEQLKTVNNTLKECTLSPLEPMSLRDLLRAHDAILNDLYVERSSYLKTFIDFRSPEYKYQRIYSQLLSRYIYSQPIGLGTQSVRDAKQLREILEAVPQRHQSRFKVRIDKLINDLKAHLITPTQATEKVEYRNFYSSFYRILKELEAQSRCGSVGQKRKVLKEWVDRLEEYSLERGEHPGQKRESDLVMIGHSLGGAAAQAHFYRYLGKKQRVLLPGKKLSLRLYDSPAINSDDNAAYKTFLKKHSSIICKNRVAIAIYQNTEIGDFFPMGGEEHLGAMRSKAEQEELKSTIDFHGRRRKRLPNAKEPTIAQAQVAHATQFAQGVRGVDYIKEKFDGRDQWRMDKKDKSNLVFRKWEVPKPFLFDLFDGPTCEKIRRSPLLFPLRYYIKSKESDVRYAQYRDGNSALALDEKGVLTCRKG